MSTQGLIVALIVVASGAYAAWTLMPSAARRAIATRVLRLALPDAFAKPFRKAVQPAGACGGCGGCGDSAATPSTRKAPPVVRLHRRMPR
jgi:hypothetical protein